MGPASQNPATYDANRGCPAYAATVLHRRAGSRTCAFPGLRQVLRKGGNLSRARRRRGRHLVVNMK